MYPCLCLQPVSDMTGEAHQIKMTDGKNMSILKHKIADNSSVNISEEMSRTAIWKQMSADTSGFNTPPANDIRKRWVITRLADAMYNHLGDSRAVQYDSELHTYVRT